MREFHSCEHLSYDLLVRDTAQVILAYPVHRESRFFWNMIPSYQNTWNRRRMQTKTEPGTSEWREGHLSAAAHCQQSKAWQCQPSALRKLRWQNWHELVACGQANCSSRPAGVGRHRDVGMVPAVPSFENEREGNLQLFCTCGVWQLLRASSHTKILNFWNLISKEVRKTVTIKFENTKDCTWH